MALTQKPIAGRCLEDKAGPPAWKSKPSWYQISLVALIEEASTALM